MKLSHVCAMVMFGCVFACGGAAATNSPGAASPASAAPESAGLDGKSFQVMLQIPDANAVADTLRFDRGQFESTACTGMGFPQWSQYAAQPDGETVAFHVLTKHPSGTTMDWNGRIKGRDVEGTANRTMNGKTEVLTFKGSAAL
jgi:hypothetical protein